MGYLCDIASTLFPYNGDIRYIFLFAAFKLHPSGPLGTLLHEIVQAVDMMTNSRRSTSTMYLQHCDRFAKCMCVGRRSRCALPANGVYRELQCEIRRVLDVNFECLFWPINQMHAFITKILGTLWPLFYFLKAFSKALNWHKAEEYVLK